MVELSNYKLHLKYCGDAFFGFRKSEGTLTVESCLEDAFEKIFGHKVAIQGASRTDKGVHADEQVINFFLNKQVDTHLLLKSLKCHLPGGIEALELQQAEANFHPTLSCKKKRYRYQFSLNTPLPYHYLIDEPIDIELMHKAAQMLVGTHNFFSFTCRRHKYTDFIRTLYTVDVQQNNATLYLFIEGNHFLYKMVRNLSDALLKCGSKKLSLTQLETLLKEPSISFLIDPLPASNLFLEKVFY